MRMLILINLPALRCYKLTLQAGLSVNSSSASMISWTTLGASRRVMLEKAKENWLRFKHSEPGHRFKDRYHRRQQSSSGRFNLRKVVSIVGGILVIAGGIVAVPVPGPGWLIILLGIGMFAGESKLTAHFMDWAEVGLRRLAGWAMNFWTSSSATVRVLVVLVILVCVAMLGYGAYYLFFGG